MSQPSVNKSRTLRPAQVQRRKSSKFTQPMNRRSTIKAGDISQKQRLLLLSQDIDTLTNENQMQDKAPLSTPSVHHQQMEKRVIASVSLDVIKQNICTSKECLQINPHRHQINACKQHPYCLADSIKAPIPSHTKMPIPNPAPRTMAKMFTRGVSANQFGPTGQQRPGTKTTVTQLSLDEYLAQQWKIDLDNMPHMLPDELAAVQKRFQVYTMRGLHKKFKPSTKPTLKKKLNQWTKAQDEMRKIELELLYWQSNQDPKIYALLDEDQKELRDDASKGKSSRGTFGKRNSLSRYFIDKKDMALYEQRLDQRMRDMVPTVYSSTLNVDPVINQLNREHEEIQRQKDKNPGADFAELTDKYYAKKEKLERQELQKKMMSMRQFQKPENYLPCKVVKHRMDSEHLNEWMKRGEIQEAAERFIEYKEMLSNLEPDEFDRLYKAHLAEKQQLLQEQFDRTKSSKNRVWSAMPGNSKYKRIEDSLTVGEGTIQKTLPSEQSQTKQASQHQLQTMLLNTSTTEKRARREMPDQTGVERNVDLNSSQQLLIKNQEMHQTFYSTTEAATINQQQWRKQSPGSSQTQNLSKQRRARLLSSKAGGNLPSKETFESTTAGMQDTYTSVRQSLAMPDQPSQVISSLIHDERNTSLQANSRSQNNMIKVGSINFMGRAPLEYKRNGLLSKDSGAKTSVLNSMIMTPKKTQSFTVMVKSQLNRGESQPEITRLDEQINQRSEATDKLQTKTQSQLYVQENLDHNEIEDARSISKISEVGYQSHARLIKLDQTCPDVFKDLMNADESLVNGHMQHVFSNAKYQSQKDHLITSMNQHMQRHRTKVRMSADQRTRKLELTSWQKQGNHQLQHQLATRFSYNKLKQVSIPSECKEILNEVPALINDKRKQDERVRNARDVQKNPCTRQAMQRSNFPTSAHVSTTLNQKSIPTKTDSQRQTEHQESKLTSTLQEDTGSTMQSQKRQQQQLNTQNQSFITETAANKLFKTNEDARSKVVPKDCKPDIKGITAKRISSITKKFVDKTQLDPHNRPAWRKKAYEENDDDESTTNSPHLKTSQNQQITEELKRQSTKLKTSSTMDARRLDQSQMMLKRKETKLSASMVNPMLIEEAGIGAPVTGALLRKAQAAILSTLDNEIDEKPYSIKFDMELTMPKLEMDPLDLNKHIKDMNSVDFWHQQGLKDSMKGRIDAAIDYYRQGLRQNPTEHVLIYSLAICYSQLKKFDSALQWYTLGLNLNPRWVDGLCGSAVCYFNVQNFEKALEFTRLAQINYKGALKTNAKLDYQIVCLIHATCLKMTKNLDEAAKVYIGLEDQFKRNQAKDLIKLMWGLILIPLSEERKVQADHCTYLKEYLEHVSEAPIPPMEKQNLLLSKYCIGASKRINHRTEKLLYRDYLTPPPRLDLEAYPKSIWTLLNSKSFFKRFVQLRWPGHKRIYENIIQKAEIELFAKEQPVFLNDRIAVVTMGSIEIRRHNCIDLLKPFIVKKAIEGDIIGFSEGDDQDNTASPLTWLLSMQDQTEVVFIKQEDWADIWNLQKKFTEQQIVLQKLEQNKNFKRLNMTTRYHLVYENLDMKSYFPGQLIMSVHQRSPFCEEYQEMYRNGMSKFRREIDARVLKQMGESCPSHQTIYQNYIRKLNQGEQSKQLEELKNRIITTSVQNSMLTSRQVSIKKLTESTERSKQTTQRSVQEANDLKVSSQKHISSLCTKSQEEQDSVDSDNSSSDSNSTDYGLRHAALFFNDQSRSRSRVEQLDSFESSQSYIDELQDEMSESAPQNDGFFKCLNDNEKVQKPVGEPLNVPLLTHGMRTSVSLVNVPKRAVHHATASNSPQKPDNNRLFNNTSRSRSTTGQPSAVKSSLKQSRSNQVSPIRKVVKIDDIDSRILNEENYSKKISQDFEKNQQARQSIIEIEQEQVRQSKLIKTDLLSEILNFETAMYGKKVVIEDQKVVKIGETEEEHLQRLIKMQEQARKPTTTYKFLIQKQVDKIKSNDVQAKREHRETKKLMKGLIDYAKQLSTQFSQVQSSSKNEQNNALRKLITVDFDRNQNKMQQGLTFPKFGKCKSQEQSGVHLTSGISNSLLIDQVDGIVKMMSKKFSSVENSQELLYTSIVDAIERNNKRAGQRREPTGVHFIESGEVLVVGSKYSAHTRLNVNDSFGMCDLLSKTGVEFLGDLRAGINQVQTFFFKYEDIRKRLSIPEKIKLKTMDLEQDRLEGVCIINFVATKENVSCESLRKF